MINWFRGAKQDVFKPQVKKVLSPSSPTKPKSVAPKKVKKTFVGPKAPTFYKRRLYVPQPFIQSSLETSAAAPEALTEEELSALMPTTTPESVEDNWAEDVEDVAPVQGVDPVANGLATIGNIIKITYQASPHCCSWCTALNGRTWSSVEEFSADKANIVKPGADLNHLSHPNCACRLIVDTSDGRRVTVNSAGIPS